MRDRALIGLITITLVASLACTAEPARVTPTPTVAASAAAPTTPAPTPTRTTTAAPSAAVVPSASANPGTTPAACPTLTGGSPLGAPRVAGLRAAHNPGVDRFVVEFTEQVVPQYEIKGATSAFGSPSGSSVLVDGNSFISVRVAGQAHNDAGQRSYPQADPLRPGLPLIREVKLITDFEGAVIFGVGLERVTCPTVLLLFSPPRIVLDFPSPP